mmetsp:Transcript_4733/g.13657  ORF Transcript_4733/g.13657 Transcript_4733/m.13657 type:complete len:170 (+) Transcript_4733:2147-2656(+)
MQNYYYYGTSSYYDNHKGISKEEEYAIVSKNCASRELRKQHHSNCQSFFSIDNAERVELVHQNQGFISDLFGYEGCCPLGSRWKTIGRAKFKNAPDGSETVEAVASDVTGMVDKAVSKTTYEYSNGGMYGMRWVSQPAALFAVFAFILYWYAMKFICVERERKLIQNHQ